MTMKELAAEIQVSPRSYEGWEQGRPITPTNLRELARFFGLHPEALATPASKKIEDVYAADDLFDVAAETGKQKMEEGLRGRRISDRDGLIHIEPPLAEPDEDEDEGNLAGRLTDLERELAEVRTSLREVVELLAGTVLSEKDEALDRLAGQLKPTSVAPLDKPDVDQGQ